MIEERIPVNRCKDKTQKCQQWENSQADLRQEREMPFWGLSDFDFPISVDCSSTPQSH